MATRVYAILFCLLALSSSICLANEKVQAIIYPKIIFFFCLFFALSSSIWCLASEGEKAYVLTLDHTNFTQTVSKHKFIVVEFYAPWCSPCKSLAPEYEKAASVLASHDPPVALAKVNADAQENMGLAQHFEIQGFPTLKIFKDGGEVVQDYKGPHEADGIVKFLKKQVGPASFEIKTPEDAESLIDDKKLFVVGIFPTLSGEEYENFTILAEKLRSDYDFGHTSNAALLPRGSRVTTPTVRLLKPFDELFVDFKKFEVDALEKFIEDSSIPLVTILVINEPVVIKYFESPSAKAMLFIDFEHEQIDAYKSKYTDVAGVYKGKGLNFLLGDVKACQDVLEYFGLKEDQSPVLLVQNSNGLKFINSNVESDKMAPWLKDYVDGNVKPIIKSEPIPKTNDELVKVVVASSLNEMVLESNKNILLEIYAPWCGHCYKLAPILDEVAVSFENDANIMIAKFDGSNNDIPSDTFEVQGYPTLYFRSSSGNVVPYEGNRTKEDIIEFIQKNRKEETIG